MLSGFSFISYAMSEAADSWVALMDEFLTMGDDCLDKKNLVKDKIIKLVDLYYDALDASKKGAKVSFAASPFSP